MCSYIIRFIFKFHNNIDVKYSNPARDDRFSGGKNGRMSYDYAACNIFHITFGEALTFNLGNSVSFS